MRSILHHLTAALALLCLAEITDLAWLSGVRATITTTASKVVAAGNGSTTQWNFSFVGVSTADLIVSVTNSSGVTTVLALNSQYSVTFTPQAPNSVWSVGGFVTYPLTGSPLALGNTLTIQRQVPYTQTTPFQNQGQFLPQAVETALDLLTMQAQQLNTLFSGALVEPVTDSQPLSPLPAAAARANNALCFDATGYVPQPCATVPASSLLILGTPSIASVPIATSPTTATWMGDLNNASAFGLSTSGTESANATALTNATNVGPAFLPTGLYSTNLGETFTGRTWGPGQWVDVSGNSRAPWHSGISSAPNYTGSGYEGGNNATVFNGDFSKVPFATEIFITGANTAGTPSTVYLNAPPNQIPHYTSYYTASGGQSLSVAVARTGQFVYGNDVFHAGQGDLTTYSYSMFAAGPALPSSTTFLQNQAVTALAGQLTAGFDGAFLNTGQNFLNDGGFDAAGQGWNVTSNRTNATGAKNVWWNAFRSQSIGVTSSAASSVDTAFQATGFHKIVLDTSFAQLQASGNWIQAAATLAANQRIYLNATATDASNLSRFPLNAGTTYIDYNSTSGGIEEVVGGNAILTHTANGPKLRPVGFATLTACGAGLEGTFAAVNDANSITWGATITAGSSTGHVLAYCDGTNWTVAGK